ncbi:MAG: hypothetical protein N2560_10175 [Ignavibacteria bacterium]|nr:hypothetical protein [Ignavibacteria bacterium]
MKNKFFWLVLLVLVCIILYLISIPKKTEKVELVRLDTVTIVRPTERIVVRKLKPKIVYLRDTIIQTQPFIASFDTIIKKDTIYLTYNFPTNEMNLDIKKGSDTFRIPQMVVTKVKPEKSVFEQTLPLFIGFTAGFLLSKIK